MILNLYNSMFYWDFNNSLFFIADSMRSFIHSTCNVLFCVQMYFFYLLKYSLKEFIIKGKNTLQIDVEKLLVVAKTQQILPATVTIF